MLSQAKRVERYLSKVEKRSPDDCWPWLGARNLKGYGIMHWNGHSHNAHRFAWELAHGPIPDGLHCLHHCDNPPCQNPTHLFLDTNDANIADKMAKGRHRGAWGERSGSAKLTAEQVLQFGVHKKHIQAIIYGKTWKHLLPERRMAAAGGEA